jgi:acyl-CoA thioester hydrolase
MRIKIDLPSIWHYELEIPVRVYDLNYGNHVGNDTVLRFAHELRLNFYKSLGQSELNFFGKALIQADAAIEYKAQMFFGEKIKAQLSLANCGPLGFDLYYQFSNEQNIVTAKVKTGMLFFDYEDQKIAKTPEDFKNYYLQYFKE